MVILGLGSNLGDRIKQLRHALELLKKLPNFSVKQISPVYISDALLPENAPPSWNTNYLNLALRCETTLEPLELLQHTKQIEKTVGRTPEKNWGPRVIDIDILAWDDLIRYDEKLHIPHENLHERPFALWPLADVAPRWIYPLPGSLQGKTATEISSLWGSRFNGEAPLHTKQISQRIDTPQLVGILNLSPDSFSDGGNFSHHATAIHHFHHLVNCGAEIIDIGAEATGPNAKPLDPETEWQRLESILKHIISLLPGMIIAPKISLDTRHAEVAKKALSLGVDWINDVSGLDDPLMRDAVKSSTSDVVIMHHLDIPVNKNHVLPLNQDPVTLVFQWAEKRIAELEKHGIARERIIFDVGIGYGKTAGQSLELIRRIGEFKKLGVRLLMGHSRKSFLTLFTDKPADERDIETLAASFYLAKQDVDYLRVHDVEAHARVLKVMAAL